MSAAAAQPGVRGTVAAPLVYWLLVVSGLVGLTFVRLDALVRVESADEKIAPIWIGTIAGIALGQLLAWRRVRAWVPLVVVFGSLPFSWALFVGAGAVGTGAETLAVAFIPAAVCGYLSLTERGALAAFWYPAVLWILVMLDSPSAKTVDAPGALPFVVGLAALFVAFLRAREARRVALWQAHGAARLASSATCTVLRARPVRRALHVGYPIAMGAAALMVAAWIAPRLMQREAARRAHAANARLTAFDFAHGRPCCPTFDGATRPPEYFPPLDDMGLSAREELYRTCISCPAPTPAAIAGGYCDWYRSTHGGEIGSACGAPRGHSYASRHLVGTGRASGVVDGSSAHGGGGASGDGVGSGVGYGVGSGVGYGVGLGAAENGDGVGGGGLGYGGDGYGYGGAPLAPRAPAHASYSAATPTDPASPVAVTSPADPVSPVTVTSPAAVASPTEPSNPVTAPTPFAPAPESPPAFDAVGGGAALPSVSAPSLPSDAPSPWRYALAIFAAGVAVHLAARAVRRALTLRHLARPFWRETIDQRISNHWERALIGLRDAGIIPGPDEGPEVFARRAAVDGLATCATILERVRHGVRVEQDDLAEMDAAASVAYRAARRSAGVVGRAVAWVRPISSA